MITRTGMTSRNIEVGRGSGFKIMKALSLLSFLFVFTVILSGFNIRNSSAADCDCTVCHGVNVKYHGDGLSNPGNSWGSCSTCHASPPATGSHSVHSAPLSNTTYGDTVTNTAGQYQFGCGHCHSMAVTLHRNDTKDVSLYGSSIGQSGMQACNDCHGSNAPSDHKASCPSPADLTICSSCHTGHTTGHMATDGSGHPCSGSPAQAVIHSMQAAPTQEQHLHETFPIVAERAMLQQVFLSFHTARSQ